MMHSDSRAPGFDTQLDLADLDRFSDAERSALLDWYETSHADGEPGLTDFVPFLMTVRPRALKRYRAYAQALDNHGRLPQLVVALLFLRYYMTVGNEKGVLYEVVAARQWGATKAEVLDTIESGFVISGPFGANAAARSQAYLAEWPADEDRRVADPWPETWVAMAPVETGDSAAQRFFGRFAPDVRVALDARRLPVTDGSMSLPAPVAVIMDLHQAVADGRPAEAAQSAEAAFGLGLGAAELVEVVGFGALYTSPGKLDAVSELLEPVFIAGATEAGSKSRERRET